MSIRTSIRLLTPLVALGITSSALAAPVSPMPKAITSAARLCADARPAPGYRDIFARFGVRSDADARAVPAR